MNKKVLVLADPTSIHTKKWIDGWQLIEYETILSGLSDSVNDNKFIFHYRVLKREKPSIINAHSMSSYGLVSALIKRKKHTLVFFLPGSDIMIDMNRNFIYSLMSKFVLNRADILVSVSETMTKRLLLKFPNLESKILTQQYGVDIDFLNKFYYHDKDIKIITNRQWKPNSNYLIILEALLTFKDDNLKIVGYDNSNYSKEILEKYTDLEKYSTGLIPYEDNIKYVARSEIFISLTSSDGIPLSLIEAIYLGAIPIVSDIEPNRELIKDGINGFVISINITSLKEKIDEVLLLEKKQIKKIQTYNRNLVLEKFDFKKNFFKLKNKIEEYIND